MTLEEAVAKFEAGREVVTGLPMYWAQTGEPYFAIVPGGIKKEGEGAPMWLATPDLAVEYWLRAVTEYAQGRAGVVYWRERPEIWGERFLEAAVLPDAERSVADMLDSYGTKFWSVYSRLLISDSPVRWNTMEEYARETGDDRPHALRVKAGAA